MNMRSSTALSPYKEARREAVADTFTAAAETVIARKGYANTTMQDIAKEAGCASGTLYLYFKSKEQLVNAIISRHSTVMHQILQEAMKRSDDPLEKIRLNTAAFLDYFNDHQAFFEIFYATGPGTKAHLASSLPDSALKEYLVFKQVELRLLKQAQVAKSVRTDMPAEELLEFMHGTSFATVARWTLGRQRPSRADQMRLLWGFISAGLKAKERSA
jgi:AcrR family transcriptional regulator